MSALRKFAASALAIALAAGLATPLLAQGLSVPDLGEQTATPAPAQPQATPAARPKMSEAIVATVNDEIISSYDLRQRLLLLIVTSGVQVTEQSYQTYEQQALRDLIDQHLEMQEMKHYDVKVEEGEIDEEIGRMAEQSNMTGDKLMAALKGAGIDPITLRSQIRAEIGWNQLVNGRYRSRARVGHDQVDAVMEKLTIDSQKPQYQVSVIYLDPSANGGIEQAKAGAQQLYTQISKGVAPFQAVARQFSNAPSAASGGDEGWLVAGNIDPNVEAVLKQMNKGQMSAPIITDEGVYIYYLQDKTDGNSDSMVRLKQAAIGLPADASEARVAAAQKTLAAFAARSRSCASLANAHPGDGIVLADLGETTLSELQPAYEQALKPLKEGEFSQPLRTSQAVNVLYVCEKRMAGDNAPTKDSIEERMVQQRTAMLARRYLRDLRTSATIDTRG